MFGLKGRDTFNKPTSDIGLIIKKAGQWWTKLFPVVFWVVIVYVVAVIGYTWYSYLYKKDVTEQEKKAYIDKKMNEVIFKKEKFDILKNEISKRQERFDKQKDEYRDIFYEHELLYKDRQEEIQKSQEDSQEPDMVEEI